MIHAYLPATEPFEVWEGATPGSEAYAALKARRAAPLYAAIERFVPDLRAPAVFGALVAGMTARSAALNAGTCPPAANGARPTAASRCSRGRQVNEGTSP